MPSLIGEIPARQTETFALPKRSPLFSKRRRWQLIFLGLCGVLCAVSFALDERAIRFIAEHRSKPWRELAGRISDHGDWPWLMAGSLPVVLWAWWKKRPALLRLMCIAIVASSVAGTFTNTLRLTTGRTRPDNRQAAPGWYGLRYEGKWLLGTRKFSSFPSGHTATAFGFFAPFALRRNRWSLLWFIPPIVMAASRMTINAHHLSDVCFGGWFGLVAAWWAGNSRRFAACRFRKPR